MTRQRCLQPPSGEPAAAATTHRTSVPVLETQRLILRAPTLDDLPVWEALHAEPGAALGDATAGEDVWLSFANYVAGWMLHGHGLWTIERRSDGATIGFILLGVEWGDREVELGWMLAAEARGQGYATEAAGAARDFGLGLFDSFISYIDRTNTASVRVAERLGARRDESAEAAFPAEDRPFVFRHGAVGTA